MSHDQTVSSDHSIDATHVAARPTQCFRCKYDLRGTPGDRCAECGLPIEESAQKWDLAETFGDPLPIRKASLLAVAAFALVLAMYGGLLSILIVFTPFLDEWIYITMLVSVSLIAATLALLSHRPLRSVEAAGRWNRRLLGISAWMLPTLLLVVWPLAWLVSDGRSDDPGVILLRAISLALLAAGLTYPPTMTYEVRRRQAFWPVWQASRRVWNIVWIGLVFGGVMIFVAVVFGIAETYDLPLPQSDWVQAIGGGVGASLFIFSLLGWFIAHVVTLIGCRQVRISIETAATGGSDSVDVPMPAGTAASAETPALP